MAEKIAEKIPSWISRILLPEIRAIVREEVSNQLKAIDAKISALDSKVEEKARSLEAKIDERTKALEAGISSLRNEMVARFGSIEERLPLMERIVQIESRIEKLEKRVGIQ